MKVTCIKCFKEGTLCVKIAQSRGHATEHYYVLHGDTHEACSIGTSGLLPHEYKDKLRTYTYSGSQLKKLAS